MSDIYVAQVSFDSVTVTPALSPTDVVHNGDLLGRPSNVVDGGIIFVAADLHGNRFSVWIDAIRDQASSGATVHWTTHFFCNFRNTAGFLIDTLYPWDWDTTLVPISGSQFNTDLTGAGFFGGGVLSITKDYANDQMTFTTPMGSFVTSLSQGGSSNYAVSPLNPTPIYPIGLGAYAKFPGDITVQPLNASAESNFYNFQATKNGRVIFRHTLHSDDPAPLALFDERASDDAGIPISTLGAPHDDAQLSARYRVGYAVTVADYHIGGYDEYRASPEAPPITNDIDMELAHEHGILLRAGPGFYQGNQMWFQRSFDNAHDWHAAIVVADALVIGGGDLYQSPSLNWVNSGLYLCWYDGANIVESKSLDGGANWTLPVTIPFTGTNPRRIADKFGGPNFLFFVNPGGDVQVVITYDGGNTFLGPFTVVTNVGAQQLDADFAPDGSLVCSYTDAGVWKQKRSRDAGRVWT